MTDATAAGESATITPFPVSVSDEQLADLRRRLAAARLALRGVRRRSVAGRAAGDGPGARPLLVDRLRLARCEAHLNALPQFTTAIDGVDIHFIHVRSPHANALPLIMTHGWPGSVVELLGTVGPLTDPTAHGGRAEDAFDLVLPSMPGYGFSGEPAEFGWDAGRTARAWAELMRRLGYTRYVAQGGDVGAAVTDAMGRQAPEGLVGIHMNLLVTALAGGTSCPRKPRRKARQSRRSRRSGGRLRLLPRAGHPAADDRLRPAGLTRRAGGLDARPRHRQLLQDLPRLRRRPALGQLTRDNILDNITLYWLTGTGASAARSYWEDGRAQAAALAAGQASAAGLAPGRLHHVPRGDLRSPRAAGSRRPIPTSPTSTRPNGAATSPPGKSPSCSPTRCGPRSGRCADRRPTRRSRRATNREEAHDRGDEVRLSRSSDGGRGGRRSALSASASPMRHSPICVGASRRRGGPNGRPSPISRRACNSRRCRSSPAIGRRTTTGAGRGAAATPCRSS